VEVVAAAAAEEVEEGADKRSATPINERT